MSPLLQIQGLDASYGAARALLGVTLEVATGEAVVLMGRNGAGKSTTFKAIMGLIRPTAGRVVLAGEGLTGRPPHEIARAGLGWVPEDRRIFQDLTVLENLEVGRQPTRPGLAPWTITALIRLFPNLAAMLDRPAGRTSGGEQQMIAIARTLMGNPRLLLLDEPSEGLAPVIVQELAAAVRELCRQGVAVLLTEQNLRFARNVASRAYLIERGRITGEVDHAGLLGDDPALTAVLAI